MRMFIVILFFAWSCWSGSSSRSSAKGTVQTPDTTEVIKYADPVAVQRDSSFTRLKKKVKFKKPLVVHALVPLCDNEHQGIVPVNKQLGDGMNLQTNLYWGAGYGVRSYFKKQLGWKMVHDSKPLNEIVLQRVVFKKTYSNGTQVYLVADGYRGDAMKKCLRDFLCSVSGIKNEMHMIDSTLLLPVYGYSDLLVFNGHDGLMDDTMKYYNNHDNRVRECALIACYSYEFFERHLMHAHSYPIITTNGLLAPEAYALGALIDSWAMLQTGAEIRKSVANAYHSKHPSSSAGACLGLFRTGWKN
jgi:hypothetical protein